MIDRRTAAVLFTIVVFVFSLGFIYEARRPLVLLIFSALFAYLLEPLVTWFQARLGDSRTKAIAATYVTLLLGISIFLSIAGPGIVHQSGKLVEELPKLIEQLGTGDIAQQIGSSQGWNYETQLRLQEFLRAHRDSIDQFLQIAIAKIPGLATYLLWLVLIPLFAAFFLKGKSDFANTFVSLIEGRPNRRFVRAVLDDLDLMLAAFIRAQLSLCGLSARGLHACAWICAFPLFLCNCRHCRNIRIRSAPRCVSKRHSYHEHRRRNGLQTLVGDSGVSPDLARIAGLLEFSIAHGTRSGVAPIRGHIRRAGQRRTRRRRGRLPIRPRDGGSENHLEELGKAPHCDNPKPPRSGRTTRRIIYFHLNHQPHS